MVFGQSKNVQSKKPDWKPRITADGRRYWYDQNNNITARGRPWGKNEGKDGWKCYKSEKIQAGATYFYNPITGIGPQWAIPNTTKQDGRYQVFSTTGTRFWVNPNGSTSWN